MTTTTSPFFSHKVTKAQRHEEVLPEIIEAREVNAGAPVMCSKSIEIAASAEKVWTVLTGINDWSRWQTDISKASILGPLKPGSSFDWVSGGAKIHSTVHTVEELKAIGWTGKGMGIFAIHNWTMRSQNGIVVVDVNESMEGLLAKLLKGYLNKNLDRSLSRWLEMLKEECKR